MIRKTYNPILRQETYKPNFFAKIPEPGINSAILLIPGDDLRQALCITAGTDVRPSDLRKKAYNRLMAAGGGETVVGDMAALFGVARSTMEIRLKEHGLIG